MCLLSVFHIFIYFQDLHVNERSGSRATERVLPPPLLAGAFFNQQQPRCYLPVMGGGVTLFRLKPQSNCSVLKMASGNKIKPHGSDRELNSSGAEPG